MERTLIVAITSYAGMGPYVSEIVNSFNETDDIYYFFYDHADFFRKNIKEELHYKCFFYKRVDNKINKIIDLLPIWKKSYNIILKFCKKNRIDAVHFINEPGDVLLIKALEARGVKCVSTIHDLHPHEAKKEWYKEMRDKIGYKRMYRNFSYSKTLLSR